MSKKLLLVRHAKSDWADIGLRDFDRPLNKRGLENAPEMGQRIYVKQIIPDKIVSSPALRALTTAKIFAKEWKMDINTITLNLDIYEASLKSLLNVVTELNDDDDYIALFGHNNAITDLVIYLTDADLFNIPTCGMALIDLPFESWKMVSKGTGSLVFYDYPKNTSLI
ncbi:SixA phosphatase family protein [Pedobacter alpinus]|uniref:SixA phosphatase family protein n=1 Tax=Pedobacter alpinus TaxID=1590643 RepID=A0ABW5TR62_9SPHI